MVNLHRQPVRRYRMGRRNEDIRLLRVERRLVWPPVIKRLRMQFYVELVHGFGSEAKRSLVKLIAVQR